MNLAASRQPGLLEGLRIVDRPRHQYADVDHSASAVDDNLRVQAGPDSFAWAQPQWGGQVAGGDEEPANHQIGADGLVADVTYQAVETVRGHWFEEVDVA